MLISVRRMRRETELHGSQSPKAAQVPPFRLLRCPNIQPFLSVGTVLFGDLLIPSTVASQLAFVAMGPAGEGKGCDKRPAAARLDRVSTLSPQPEGRPRKLPWDVRLAPIDGVGFNSSDERQ